MEITKKNNAKITKFSELDIGDVFGFVSDIDAGGLNTYYKVVNTEDDNYNCTYVNFADNSLISFSEIEEDEKVFIYNCEFSVSC